MSRVALPLLGICLAFGLSALGSPKPTDQPVHVSLIRLIANPGAFDGKLVRVQGFVRIEHEGTAVYLHRDDCEHMLTRNGLWLAINDATPAGSRESEVNDRYALIEGRFRAKNMGHMSLWSGAIEQITRMQPWEIRKARD